MRGFVTCPTTARDFWQPVPANGYAEVRVSHRKNLAITRCATGIQVVAPGCYIREHVHPAQGEILFVFEGDGEAVIDGASHAMPRRTTVYTVRAIVTAGERQPRSPAQAVLGDDAGRR